MKTFLDLLLLLLEFPTIFIIVLVLAIILAIIFRKELKLIIFNKLPFLKRNKVKPLSMFCDDVKHVYVFKAHVVIPTYDILYKSLMRFIDKQRRNGEVLVIDLTHITQVNGDTEEALRDALRDAVKNNNVRIEVIFPKRKLAKLYTEISDYIKEKSCNSIIAVRDERIKKRKSQVKSSEQG